ncbi:hypothetical protein AGMMS49545_06900 [Betaproteobacteria bacterium]|nr:hypothetical protein AGMMS49545_06900 [Betaproteobacteria bacterium]
MKKKTPKPAPEPKKSANVARVNLEMLDAWNASRIKWRFPEGVYHDRRCCCRTCGVALIWEAWEQKEWFEEMKGDDHSEPVQCIACRARTRKTQGIRRPKLKKYAERVRADVRQWQDIYTLSRRFPDGFYCDTPYICRTCGEVKIWTAPQQKYWFEEKQGRSDSTAVYCPECRETYRQIKTEARRISAEGLAKKLARQAQGSY